MAYDYMIRINMLPRMAVRYYEHPKPEHWDMRAITGKRYWKALHWLLKKLGGQYREYIPKSYPMETINIDQRRIQDTIAESRKAMRLLWDKEATTLIIGHEDLQKMTAELPPEMISFNMEWPLAEGNHMRIAGLRVVVIPWMSGWALLPDLREAAQR